ncbi:SWI/SNF complex 60 kDa subunit [Sparassis latifolia]
METQKPAAKKRKITDKSIPNALFQSPEFTADSQMYRDLLDMERRLDWTMTRKRVEVQDTLGRVIATPRTLRIFLSHTVSGQTWQTVDGAGLGGAEVKVNPETGEGIPAWSFRIEGRLLEIPNQRAKDRVPPRKFSTFIKQMVVELDRDMTLYPEGNIVEWVRGPNQAHLDGFTVRRKGDGPTKIRIILHLEQQPEHYKVHPELGRILGLREESRTGVVQALWNYIKLQGLQDKVDRRMVRPDAYLRPLFGVDQLPFQNLPELVNRFLLPPDPIILHYTLNPAVPPPEKPGAWDVEVRVDDSTLKGRMNHVIVQMASESARDLAKLDDEIALLAQSLNNSNLKRNFLRAFADDPQGFIQTWLASQSRDLESVLGSGPSEGGTVRQEDLKRSEFFRLPWVEEAVAVQEGMRLAAKAGM